MGIGSTTALDLGSAGVGLLIVRLALGLAMAAHGSQKLFGWFGGYGLEGTGKYFEGLGFRPGKLFVAMASLAEVTSGLLIALGLLGPIGPGLMLAPMLVAIMAVHRPNGFFAAGNGIEVPYLYGIGALGLAFTGFGTFSLDALLGLTGLATPAIALAAVAVGILGGLGTLALRHPASRPAEARG
jgi:putative oxidoreductase